MLRIIRDEHITSSIKADPISNRALRQTMGYFTLTATVHKTNRPLLTEIDRINIALVISSGPLNSTGEFPCLCEHFYLIQFFTIGTPYRNK